MKKCYITGSGGFIGSNIVARCLKLGWDVTGIDNFSGSKREMADPKRYEKLPGKYKIVEADINETDLLEKLFEKGSIVFHLAAVPRVQYSTDFPVKSNHNNITGTLSVLEAARKAGVKRVVYSASSSMFGGEDIPFPTPENTPAKPRSNYALQKYTGLEYCRLFSELYGLETVGLIYYNVFGPGQLTGKKAAYNTVISAFMECTVTGKACRVDGDGSQARDFSYIDDVVDANILAAQKDGKLLGERFNVANGESHSVNEIFDTINGYFGGKLEKEMAPGRLGDPPKSMADVTKAREVLGFESKVGFSSGLRLTYDWWQAGRPTEIKVGE